MPFKDGTGPLGKGPRSGRGGGPCATGLVVPGNMNSTPGRGFGGGGRGKRNRFGAPGSAETTTAVNASATVLDKREITALKGQVDSLQNTLDQMRKRVEELLGKE